MVEAGHFFQHVHHHRTDGHFAAHIAENAHGTQHHVFVLPHAGFAVVVVFGFRLGDLARVGQLNHGHGNGQQNHEARQSQIRHLYR